MSNNTHKPTSPSPSNHSTNKCSCSTDKKQSTDCCLLSPKNKNSGSSAVVEDSPEASPSKDRNFKKSLSSFVNLRRGKSFNFKAKRGSKKITTTTANTNTNTSSSAASNSTSSNSSGSNLGSSLSKKWPLKFNCARNKDNKSPSVVTTETSSCCECVCYRRNATEDATSVPLTVDSLEGATVTTAPSSLVISCTETIESEVVAMATSSQPQQPEDGESELAAVVGNAGVVTGAAAAAAAGAVVTSAGTVASRVTIHVMTDEERQAVGIYGNSGGGNDGWEPVFHISNNLNNIHEDCDEAARLQRAREIEQGVAPPANYRRVQVLCCSQGNSTGDGSGSNANGDGSDNSNAPPRRLQIVCPSDVPVDSLRALFQANVTLRSCPLDTIAGCHTQVDFVHCLVPDLFSITNCTFYWGKMDRYEAERLLDSKPEGTFLLRDSAQEEFLFSVSFRKYGRSLHARIEQWNHKFSFDAHDPGVYTSSTVCGLIEHYKDPSSCMFFEPMLTRPLHRNFTFPLQHLARAAITTRMVYDNVNQLQLPKTLKSYLKEYHYRQKVRMENFDDDLQWLDLRSNQGNN